MAEQTPADSVATPEERLAAVLSDPAEAGKPEAEAEKQPEEGDNVVEDEVEAEADTPDEAEEGQAEGEEDEANTEEESADSDDEDKAEPQLVEIDGEQLTIEEVKLGYLRQSDYTRKTQAVAEQRKVVEEERSYYASTLNSLLSAVGADMQRFDAVDWERAAVENPDQYRVAKQAYEQSRQVFDGIRHQTEDFVNRTKQAQEAALKAQAKEAVSILKTSIPGWNNELYAQIGQYAQKELGFRSEEFNNIADHRAIQSIWKAMQYDRGRQVATEKTVKVAPTKTLSDKSAAKSRVDDNRKTNREARERLRQTGKVDDAVALLANRLR